MEITSAEFVISNTDYRKCPDTNFPEYAFIGRSNVGKSSLINMLTGHKGLAMTSARPGKTLLINHFLINKSWYLVDLPGYGYAKRDRKSQEQIKQIIESYILRREQMTCLFLLVDSRLEPQRIDQTFIEWLGENGVPFAIVFTKADKLGSGKLKLNIQAYLEKLQEQWEELPPYFITSSEDRTGRNELLNYIAKINKELYITTAMKKSVFGQMLVAALLLATASNLQAQSLKDLLNKENIEKAVNAVTGKNTASMTGTWMFTGSALAFESDNLLQKAGGSLAANAVEKKLDGFLGKVGIEPGEMSFTFNSDSTFQTQIKGKTLKGTYQYDSSTQKVNLKFSKLLKLNTTVNCTSEQMELLFPSDRLLDLVTFLASKSNNATLQSISSLAESYDGMMLGFTLQKQP